ncbi:hypothetical protein STEG23_024634, partial [Scotinomys teguina]
MTPLQGWKGCVKSGKLSEGNRPEHLLKNVSVLGNGCDCTSKTVFSNPSLVLYLPPHVLWLPGNFYILSSWLSGVFSSCCLALDSSSSFPCPAFRAIAKSIDNASGCDVSAVISQHIDLNKYNIDGIVEDSAATFDQKDLQ